MKIALFGGTFDPPHVGHVQGVLSVLEQNMVDEVWVVVTKSNPLKPEPLFPLEKRRRMVEATFGSIPRVTIVCEESQYTVDTVHALKEQYPELRDGECYFLIGNDAFRQRTHWKDWRVVVQSGTFLVMNRWGEERVDVPQEEHATVLYVNTPRFDISSTEVRKRISEGKYISHLVHPTVEKILNSPV